MQQHSRRENPSAWSGRESRRSSLFSLMYTSTLLLFTWTFTAPGYSLGHPSYVQTTSSAGSFSLVQAKTAAVLYVDDADYPGVLRAVGDLQSDLLRVSGCAAQIVHKHAQLAAEVVLIGTIGSSPVIDRLISDRKIDVSDIQGKWESALIQIVDNPLPGIKRSLVIAGSDKRGTIYGIYDLSEQIGVSPWYWWADVPIAHKDSLFVKTGRYVQGEPAVKYRGIFLNDEAPALTGWVNATYGGYNHHFYERVFELILRLKGNYLWPAMWNSAFNEDDPLNPHLADEYGIVMGTSHHEPMLRAQQEWQRHGTGPWDYSANADVLNKFWNQGIERNKNYESTITIGMRGDGDMPMTEGSNIALLEKIVADQRRIISEHMTPTLASDPEVWALYKEVQAYYENGMRVPNDVTLLWCDDNWGNIRRLPTAEEKTRSGGAGIYYHVDYVGDPRSYKWINTYPLTKIWEQMNLAEEYGANRIWILNVGDLKPMELPIEFFLDLAREPARWRKDNITEFTELWATREFGPAHADEIAALVSNYTKYNGRRKPEQLSPDTFNLIDYDEANRVFTDWAHLVQRAEALQKKLPADQQDAYFELVLYPLKAAAIVNELYITAGRNHLYATQGRASTNELADQARALFKQDAELSSEYNHKLAGGKWNHMMDQTHIGYTFWNEPPANAMPAVTEVQVPAEAKMGISLPGIGVSSNPMQLTFDYFNRQSYAIELFNRGEAAFSYVARSSAPWIDLDHQEGTVTTDTRVMVNINWDGLPAGENLGSISITQTGGVTTTVRIRALRPDKPSREGLAGFVEADGYVAIEAEHYNAKTSAGGVHWDVIHDFGETLSGMTIFPVTAKSAIPPEAAPSLEYNMYLFDKGDFDVEATLAPTLNFVPGRGLRFAISFDEQLPVVVDALAQNTEKDWSQAVSDGVRRVKSRWNLDTPGYHTLKVSMVDPGVVLERIVVSHGPMKPSYLGPPESYRGSASLTSPK
jgi:Glycosyl hydrolase family 115/Gylcosyl hydrolase family 115 C-terminal domain